jgi:hypothetical protein
MTTAIIITFVIGFYCGFALCAAILINRDKK